MASSGYSLKDDLFNKDTIKVLAKAVKKAYEPFEADRFFEEAMVDIEPLELKERMALLADMLAGYIEEDYEYVLEIFCEAVKGQEEGQFIFGAFLDYIMINGCTVERLDISLKTMGALTGYFSAEFAIRPFINKYPKETLTYMACWSLSDDFHKRRLASEGLRPLLPWAPRIDLEYEEAAAYLDNLYYDGERYVTRSVANHLNDISKMEPTYVIDRLKSWKASGKQKPKEMTYIINHSLRTLVKQGNKDALELLGYHSQPSISVSDVRIENPSIHIGDTLLFEFDITADREEQLMIDYQIDYPMAGGKRSTKVFKIKKTTVKEGQTLEVVKKHPFKVMTTKKLYTGDYKLALQINGNQYPEAGFHMTVY